MRSFRGSWGMRFEGVLPNLMRRYRQTSSEAAREHYKKFFSERHCEACGGLRLRPESLAVRVQERSIAEVMSHLKNGLYETGLLLEEEIVALEESPLTALVQRSSDAQKLAGTSPKRSPNRSPARSPGRLDDPLAC